jgi:hypothetical protein
MTTLQEFAKNLVEAVTGGRIREAFSAIDGAYRLKETLTGQIYGATAARRGRGRPAKAAAGNGGAERAPAAKRKDKPDVPAILRERGPLDRTQIIAAAGWKNQAANLQLARLIKAGEIVLEDGRYRAAAPAQAAA